MTTEAVLETPHLRRCMTAMCRVETFKATYLIPLSGCPVCLLPGSAVEQPSGDDT